MLDETAGLVTEAGGSAFPRLLDVTDPTSVDDFVSTVEDVFGPVDVLVNNAAIAIPGPFWELTAEDLEREVRTNLLVGSSADVNTSCPEYKVVAVDVRPVAEQPAYTPALAEPVPS